MAELIDLERECCTWIKIDLVLPAMFELTAEGEGAEVLAGMLRPDLTGRIAF